ncbi:MAG: hydroxyacylglutathione hydrolase [Rhizobiales bacterium]|nr:hydroxyacylglutathione hydrolase [Hyphomicrobiales bacterium]
MAHLDLHHFICREDNYGVLAHDHRSGATASIDAPDALAVERALKTKGWQLTHILTTHHHGDHVEGNLALKEAFGCTIIGPRNDGEIPGMDKAVAGGDTFTFAGREVRVMDTPGHTKGHIVYYLPSEHVLFAGDTLFEMGCGRVIEGTLEQMWQSLDQLRKLPTHTIVHVGHEYSEANARFGLSIEPGNRALQQRAGIVAAQRTKGEMTLPTTIGEELKTNVFLRPESPEIRKKLGLENASDAEVFAETRRRKDSFK